MAGLAPEGSRFDAPQYDTKISELLQANGQDSFTSYGEVNDSFDDMRLDEKMLRCIYAYGFEKPSAIQQIGIVPFCKGLDVLGPDCIKMFVLDEADEMLSRARILRKFDYDYLNVWVWEIGKTKQ